VFTWDPAKAIANFEKHGVSFEEGATLFDDPDALDWKDKNHSLSEPRFKRIGTSLSERVLLVVYTIRRIDHGKETIRIISARKTSRKERKAYAGL